MQDREISKGTASGPRRGARIAPLYQQVYARLRDWLEETAPDSETALPSEPLLARQYGVSRITIRRTLEQLEAEGMIRRLRGRGTFPVPQGTGAAGSNGVRNISGYLDNVLSYDVNTTARTLNWQEIEPQGRIAEIFGPGKCLRIVRLRRLGEQPISYTTLHVPGRLAPELDPQDDDNKPLILALEERGIIAERTEQALSATSASGEVAHMLGVEEGAPLVAMRRLMLSADFEPVLHQESLYAPERFEYRMILTRTQAGSAARWTPIA